MTMNNIPTYAYNYEYIVGREVDGELWFWGAYSTAAAAEDAAREIGGDWFPTSWFC